MEAPRWRLTQPHYLNIPGVEWERQEIHGKKTARQRVSVPSILDPRDESDHNYPGEIIVAHAVDGARNQPKDIIFIGDPTPEMEPLNEAAEAISRRFEKKWNHPIESLTGDFNQSMLAGLEQALASAIQKAGGIPTGPLPVEAQNQAVSAEAFEALQRQVIELTAALQAANTPKEVPARRI